MERILIDPPFADPTQPYVALPTLKGHLRAAGLDARVLDLNVGAFHHLFRPERIEDLARRLGARFAELNRSDSLDFSSQMEYRALGEARPGLEDLLAAEEPPLEVFRRRDLFADPARYGLACRRVEALFEALGAVHFPYRFGPNRAGHGVLPWSFDLLEEYREGGHSPLEAFYREVFDGPEDWEAGDSRAAPASLDGADFIGISIAFPSQIPEAFHLLRFLRDRAPRAFLALGGPCVHQVALALEGPLLERLLAHADGIGIFEGEETLVRLFPVLPAWREAGDGRQALLREVPNLLFRDPETGAPSRGPFHQTDLAEAAAPDYSDLDLDLYLAPGRALLYAPTRGCYWNRCSFCRYGLSEESAARYREVPPERVASHLAKLSRRHGTRTFYLSSDVLSPSYALKLARALIDRGTKLRWSTDLKVDRHFTRERCDLLHRSGLRAAAFGIESGSDRVLELIGKGSGVAAAVEVSRSFHAAGIATQWMTFTGHPGETPEEALETVRLIEREEDSIDLFIVGEFSLELGSLIAREPDRFGVEGIHFAEGDELRLFPLFRAAGEAGAADRARIDRAIRAAASRYALRPYPWAGAISTHHTLLHFIDFGPRAFRTHFRGVPEGGAAEPPPSGIPGLRERPRFSLAAIADREKGFLETYLPRALTSPGPGGDGSAAARPAPLSQAHLREAVAKVEPARPLRS